MYVGDTSAFTVNGNNTEQIVIYITIKILIRFFISLNLIIDKILGARDKNPKPLLWCGTLKLE